MSSFYEIPVIIPAYEPGKKLVPFVQELIDAGIQNIVIVDDGSGENYRAIFEQIEKIPECVVLHHAVNLGKGRALKTAFNECLYRFPTAIGCVTADSDGQHTAKGILDCMEALANDTKKLVLGCRDFDAKDVPARSSFGNKCTRKVFQYLLGLSITDTQTGLRAIPKFFMEKLMNVKGERFEYETNMLIETKNLGVEIQEVKIDTIYIEENKASHFNPIKDSIRIYMVFGKFLFSSLSSSVVDLGLFWALCSMLKESSNLTGLDYIVQATVMARVLSAIYNYLLNYKVVFKSKAGVVNTAIKYAALAVCQMCLSAFLVKTVYGWVGGMEVLVKVPVDVFLFFLSFVIQREFVYRNFSKRDKIENGTSKNETVGKETLEKKQ